MIRLTRRDGSHVYVSADLIESVEPTPETLVVLVDGKRLFPTESCEEIVAAIVAYRGAVEAVARHAVARALSETSSDADAPPQS